MTKIYDLEKITSDITHCVYVTYDTRNSKSLYGMCTIKMLKSNNSRRDNKTLWYGNTFEYGERNETSKPDRRKYLEMTALSYHQSAAAAEQELQSLLEQQKAPDNPKFYNSKYTPRFLNTYRGGPIYHIKRKHW